jgi:regulator of replication initiation timing
MSSRVAVPGVARAHHHDTMARCLYLHYVKKFLLFCVAGQLQGQLAAEQQARSAVSKELAGAHKDMEAVVQHNRELKCANTAMGEENHQLQVEQQELRASLEAQTAELTSVKVSTSFPEHDLQIRCVASFP